MAHRWPKTSIFMKGIIAKATLAVTGATTLTGALTLAARLLTTKDVGTAGTGVTAVEYGDGLNHTTKLTLAALAATIGDNASLAGGNLIYTFPPGVIVINSVTLSVGMTLTTGTPTTDTPELGLGTTIASGANATLGAVAATAEDVAGPAVLDDIAGTAEIVTKVDGFIILAAAAHTLHINWADAFADVDNTDATLDGTVTINWSLLPLT